MFVFSQTDTSLYTVRFNILTFDDTGSKFNYIRYEYVKQDRYHVWLTIDDNVVMSQSRPPIPEQFKYKVKVDSNRTYTVYTKQQDGSVIVTHPDSIEQTDYVRADSHLVHVQGIVFDTIRFLNQSFINTDAPRDNLSSECQYRYDQKHGYEKTYYQIEEIKSVVISGPNYRLKTNGSWKHGKKDGTWEYFSPNGELERTEKWKNGVLIRTKYHKS